MKIGVSDPVTGLTGDPADLRRFVAAIEAPGCDHDGARPCRDMPHDGCWPRLPHPWIERDGVHDPFPPPR